MLTEAERNGTNKTIRRAKRKLLKAENALQRDMQVGEAKGKKRESSYQLVKSQKKEKAAEIKETKKIFRDSVEKLADRKTAERKELAKIFSVDVAKAAKMMSKIQKTGKAGEIKDAQGKMAIAMLAVQKATKKNIKSAIGDKRSIKDTLTKLAAADLAIDKMKAVKADYKEDINVITDDIKNQDLLVKRRADELRKLIQETKGPLDAYKIPLRAWERALKDVETESEKLDLASGEVSKATKELKALNDDDLKKAKDNHKKSTDKDLKSSEDKLKKATEAVAKAKNVVKKEEAKLVKAEKNVKDSEAKLVEASKGFKTAKAGLVTADKTKTVGDEKRKVLNAAKETVKKTEKKEDNAKLKVKKDKNRFSDLKDTVKNSKIKVKKAQDFVKDKEKKVTESKKLVASNLDKIKKVEHRIKKKTKKIAEYKKAQDVKQKSLDEAKAKAEKREEIKEKARKALSGADIKVEDAKILLRKARKGLRRLKFNLKNEERILFVKLKIEQSVDGLTAGLATLDTVAQKSMERNVALKKQKFKLAEKKYKGSEKLLAAETVALKDADKLLKDSEKDEPKKLLAEIAQKACAVRLKFATEEKARLYQNYIDTDNNLLLDENILESDKNTRAKEVMLHKAWEFPKEYDSQEASAKFHAEREKFVNACNAKIEKKSQDIKNLKKGLDQIDSNSEIPKEEKDKQKAILEELIIKEEKTLEMMESTNEKVIDAVLSSDDFDKAKKSAPKFGIASEANALSESIAKNTATINQAASKLNGASKNVTEVAIAKINDIYKDSQRGLRKAQNREAINLKLAVKLAKATNGELDDDDLEEIEDVDKQGELLKLEEEKIQAEREKLRKKRLRQDELEADQEESSDNKKEDKQDKDDEDDDEDASGKEGKKGKKGKGKKK